MSIGNRPVRPLCSLLLSATTLGFVGGFIFESIVLGDPPATSPALPTPSLVMPNVIRQYQADAQAVSRFYEMPWSNARLNRMDRHLREWNQRLSDLPFDTLDVDGRIDYLLLANEVRSELAHLKLDRTRRHEMQPLLPFMDAVHELETARWRMEKLDVAKAAATVASLPEMVRMARKSVEEGRKKKPADAAATSNSTNVASIAVSPALAQRTAVAVGEIRSALKTWLTFYEGNVPEFSWWMKKPAEAALSSLDDYAKFLKEEVAGLKGKEEDPLVGDPIGASALADDLRSEWLAYSAEELLAIGERELAWCEVEMKKAAAEMGLGADWKAALAKAKSGYVAPGQQEQLVAEQAREAIEFLKVKDLVTVPPLCEELWRTSMLSSEAQKTLPFAAYSGPNMLVAYARDDMKHEDKLMTMRGNNRYFTRVVAAHELIPGHHLEAFMTSRYNEHRRVFRTPFYVEGWALYWEINFWKLGYSRTPEERIGMLIGRLLRSARIIVSLRFHLGQMTPAQMVDFIVERAGHERLSATSEVRRFIGGAYSPLYQCAYMIGGLQLRSLRDEMVRPGGLTDRQFNDAILHLGSIPIELLRDSMLKQSLPRDARPEWRSLLDKR